MVKWGGVLVEVDGKDGVYAAGNLGDDIKITRDKTKITVTPEIDMSKR